MCIQFFTRRVADTCKLILFIYSSFVIITITTQFVKGRRKNSWTEYIYFYIKVFNYLHYPQTELYNLIIACELNVEYLIDIYYQCF